MKPVPIEVVRMIEGSSGMLSGYPAKAESSNDTLKDCAEVKTRKNSESGAIAFDCDLVGRSKVLSCYTLVEVRTSVTNDHRSNR